MYMYLYMYLMYMYLYMYLMYMYLYRAILCTGRMYELHKHMDHEAVN